MSTHFNQAKQTIPLSANNIVLIGFMGCGKSTVGRLLASEVENAFLDTDDLIEKNAGKTIQEIFAEKGEEYFRELEVQTVQWLITDVNNTVISTGGGMLMHCDNLDKVGKIVYLKVPFETILSRMNRSELAKRPLLSDQKEAEKKYHERSAIYEERADIIIDADASVDTVLTRLRCAVT